MRKSQAIASPLQYLNQQVPMMRLSNVLATAVAWPIDHSDDWLDAVRDFLKEQLDY